MAENKVNRRLAAILAADMVGYSRLMGTDEAGTIARQKAYRTELIDPRIAECNGRIVKTTGDGLLVEFGSAVEAVRCAVEIQRALSAREAGVAEDGRIAYRIGINLGDIVIDGDDILGDGVNVAARLEALAEPGGIAISDTVFRNVKGKLDLGFADLGPQKVKNIADPLPAFRVLLDPADAGRLVASKRMRRPAWRRSAIAATAAALVAMVVAAGLLWWRPWVPPDDATLHPKLALQLPARPSIAVLPFDNLSGDKDQEYFADGVTEDLITALSKVSGLFVIARNSTFVYKGKTVDVRQIGRDLGVRYVLEGSVRRAGARLRISAQLINATTGYQVWADRFDRQPKDVFSVQDEVVGQIISALKVRLTPNERRVLVRKATDSLDAYDLFLRAYAQFWHLDRDSNAAARALLVKAVTLDPKFARAYASLARTYVAEVDSGWTDAPQQSLRMAELLARKAVSLDDSLPEVHFVMGVVHMNKREHAAALSEARRAIALNPNFADGFGLLAWILQFAGRADKSLPIIAKAMRLNPGYSLAYLLPEGEAYFTLRRYPEAARAFKEALNRNPAAQRVRIWLAASYALAGRQADAEWEAQEILTRDKDFSIGRIARTIPYKFPADLQRLIDGLRKAGLPE